jgi:hypothetical protein
MVEDIHLTGVINTKLKKLKAVRLSLLSSGKLLVLAPLSKYSSSCLKEAWLQNTILPDSGYETMDKARVSINETIVKIREVANRSEEFFNSGEAILEVDGVSYTYDYYRRKRLVIDVPESIDNYGLVRCIIISKLLLDMIYMFKPTGKPISIFICFSKENKE